MERGRGRGRGRGQLFRGRGRGQGQVFWPRGRGLNEDLTSLQLCRLYETTNKKETFSAEIYGISL